MIVPGPATRIFLAPGPTDLRRSFDGLHGLVRAQLQEDPRSGHLFLFCNRLRTRLKVLCFDGSGLWICANRPVLHCPLNAGGETVLSIPSLVPQRSGGVGSDRTAIRHDRGPIAGRISPGDSGLDVR